MSGDPRREAYAVPFRPRCSFLNSDGDNFQRIFRRFALRSKQRHSVSGGRGRLVALGETRAAEIAHALVFLVGSPPRCSRSVGQRTFERKMAPRRCP
jgi:hypothetical protein